MASQRQSVHLWVQHVAVGGDWRLFKALPQPLASLIQEIEHWDVEFFIYLFFYPVHCFYCTCILFLLHLSTVSTASVHCFYCTCPLFLLHLSHTGGSGLKLTFQELVIIKPIKRGENLPRPATKPRLAATRWPSKTSLLEMVKAGPWTNSLRILIEICATVQIKWVHAPWDQNKCTTYTSHHYTK